MRSGKEERAMAPGTSSNRLATAQPQWRHLIRERREAAGLNQRELTRRTGLTPEYLNAIERRTRQPGVLTLIRIARALGVSIDDLIVVEDEGMEGATS
jgi:transcriptional regulator with XRE-family HTH domain